MSARFLSIVVTGGVPAGPLSVVTHLRIQAGAERFLSGASPRSNPVAEIAALMERLQPKAEIVLGQTLTTDFPEMLDRPAVWFAACKVAFDARQSLLRAAERRFCRAMRRHEKRALALGMPHVRAAIRLERRRIVPEAVKPERVEQSLRRMAEHRRSYGEGTSRDATAAYLYERAADAAGKLVVATAAAWAAHPVPGRST